MSSHRDFESINITEFFKDAQVDVAPKSVKKTVKSTVKKIAKPAKTAAKTPAKKPVKTPAAAKARASYKLKVGDRVPSFSGASTSGHAMDHEFHAKKTLVLYFYPRDNTPGCTLEGQDFRRLYKQFQQAGAEIVGISQDPMASHKSFKSKCDFPFELLSDEDGSVCRAFDVMQMKSMYGRDFLGIERSTFVIDGGVIKNEWRKVKVDGHAHVVLEAVKAL